MGVLGGWEFPYGQVASVVTHGATAAGSLASGDTTPCRMTGVTSPGVVSPDGSSCVGHAATDSS